MSDFTTIEKEVPEEVLALQNEFDEFIYLASHDLKEPARKITTFGQRLSKSLKGKLSEEEEDFFARMMDAANRQQAMIDDLLKLSRINTADFKRQRIMLHELVEELNIDERTEFKYQCPKIAYGDRPQLKIALQEVIDNAEKFNIGKVKIKLSTKSIFSTVIASKGLNPSRNYAYLIFSDNGIGIPEDQMSDIFRPFYRVNGRSEYDGAGMGLSIAKAILEKMGGAIWMEKPFSSGTSVHILLPAA
ncbi:HAMP domain-containing sensor histidine kinase [uncultured Arcticibacterium sp.]|uniref:sensor histidine kinase n=1 Tax=uncultured Arcticibacterium sp. TaxID=2173042 RepID=UPI0030F70E24